MYLWLYNPTLFSSSYINNYKTLTLGQDLLLYIDYLIKAQQNPFRFIHFIDDKTEKQII